MPMIDYISATLYDCKVTPNLWHLQKEAVYSSGWEKFFLCGCDRLSVYWHPIHRMIRIDGSIPYYWQGNNYLFNNADFAASLYCIKVLL